MMFAKGSLPSPLGKAYFSKYGKVWASKLAFHQHISLIEGAAYSYATAVKPTEVYDDCTVIVIDVDGGVVSKYPFEEYYKTFWVERKRKGK
jgi:hypothetical protein